MSSPGTMFSFGAKGCALILVAGLNAGCTFVFDYVIDYTVGYRSPIGVRISFTRRGTPIREEAFDKLQVGTSDLGEALKTLGAPHKLWRTSTEEILEYYYLYGRNTRLVFRPLFFLPHGSYAAYNFRGSETGLDVAMLAFDHEGRLRRKEFRASTPRRTAGAVAQGVFVP